MSDHVRGSESINQTISYHQSVDRSANKKESALFLFNSTQAPEVYLNKNDAVMTENEHTRKVQKIASMTMRRT